MASKTTYIPRYLLPQYGALWRSAAFARRTPELGQVLLVRYAAARSSSTKTSPKSPAAKAAKHSAPTKPLPKAAASKAAAAPVSKEVPPQNPILTSATPHATPTPASPPKTAAATTTTTSTSKTQASSFSSAAAAKSSTPPLKPAASGPSKPIVLEKPERFNPPSHGARLPRSTPRHYGGPMSDDEMKAQAVKTYPGLPPPENTWSHWFIHSRGIHLFITLGTLTSLAIYTFITNFNAKSPFADLIPPISEFPRHPFQYLGVLLDVMRMHEEHESAITAEKRRRKVDDVAKRNEYRKAHGLEPTQGFWSSSNKTLESQTTESIPIVEPAAVAASAPEIIPATAEAVAPEEKPKKFLGIF
ncbi:uncharacterized protein F4812DRAFT_165169 [Daldinia caldariorum]|uniref:uncharacterized protein n=1 Tax=Daldinia caldariorum TaxID=326644 RepID=UPI002008B96F|nr:uncharacterized protein F4812DRAFT_165169 [Daldinia caldariorum]KAI1471072.1 hypothetical protein F4812DRAFT_165169 [Daldinia caldariorum]